VAEVAGTEDIQARPPLADRLNAAAADLPVIGSNAPLHELLREAAGEITRQAAVVEAARSWAKAWEQSEADGSDVWSGYGLACAELRRKVAVLGPSPTEQETTP
jgi:hypothetical protein